MATQQKLMNTGVYGQERFLALLESANNGELFYGDELSALETVNEGSESHMYSGSEQMLSNVHAWQNNGSDAVKESDLAEPEGLQLISGLIEPTEADKGSKECMQISDTGGAEQVSESDTSWVRRHRRGAMPDERTIQAERVTALESAIRGFAGRKTDSVITPKLGLSYDSLTKDYDFYNLYSWECGFGIRYGKSGNNVKGARCMQEFVCCCSGKPNKENNSSCRTKWHAMVSVGVKTGGSRVGGPELCF
ncbi:uncharacterized protein [Triticum aestivum]|uniref:uncharacterized protein n=1 Tax=Triticum aestivum TaxID=4565 RepID=UPI001D033D59|nr:uncharacterized protein LOC123147134 [Triticum aestivum]